MNDFTDIQVSVENLVATVEIQRAPHNFFDLVLIQQLSKAFDILGHDSNCRTIVLASEGKSFCAGANFGSGQPDESGSDDFTEKGFQNTTGKLYTEAAKLFACRKPIVAAVHGPAIGGGFGLALVADFRVGSEQTRFSANFVKLGLHQGFGITRTLPRLVGTQNAHRLLLTGKRISGPAALDLGLVDKLVSPENVRKEAISLASEIAENAPLAISSVRATMQANMERQVREITKHELSEQQRLRGTQDAYEGIRAVAERRPGNFSGN